MRRGSPFARGLGLAAALTAVAPVALAAPRQKKPASHQKAAAAKRETAPVAPAPTPPASPSEAPRVEVASDEPAPTAPTAPTASPAAPSAVPVQVHVAANQPLRQSAPHAGAKDEATLGRREAARLAAGRIEVAVWASGGVANRRFTYRDAVGYNLAPYRLPVAPMASFGIEAYPAAASGVPLLRDLGIRAHVSRGFAFDSNTPQNVTLETNWTRFGGELRERVLRPGTHAFELGVLVGADASYFGMKASAPVPALLPAARTVSLRFGIDAKLRVAWRLSVLVGGAYLLTTSRGEIYEHFQRPRVSGLDADFGFAIDLGSGFEARLTGRYTRYFASFRPRLGDEYVAGGALDEQLQAGLGVRYAH